MRRWLIALTVLALAGCSTAPEPAPPPPVAAPPAPPPPPAPIVDACGASGLQHLVGRPRTEIPVPVRPERQRVACSTCPVTMDFDPTRLNFFFEATTGRITEVRCG